MHGSQLHSHVSARKLTRAWSPNSRGAGFRMASRSALSSQFSHNYRGLERAHAPVNLPERRFRRGSFRRRKANESVRDRLTSRWRHTQIAYKMPVRQQARFPAGITRAHPFQWSAQSSVKSRRDVGSSIRIFPSSRSITSLLPSSCKPRRAMSIASILAGGADLMASK